MPTDNIHQPRLSSERLLRALSRCDASEPMTCELAQRTLGCSHLVAQKALSRLVKAGLAVRYAPGAYGPLEGA
jgi:hypothetical protein